MTDQADRRRPRRAFLAGAGAALASLWLPRSSPAAPMRRWVDVHHHFIPPGYAEFFQSARSPDGKPAVVPPTSWDLALDMEDMDRSGTATAMLSMFVPPQLGTPATRAQLARSINEHAARLRDEHPGRFGMFAALPLPDVEASLKELAYAGDHLSADGYAVYTNTGDRWLGDAAFEPLFQELDKRRSLLFVHPTTANCCQALLDRVPDNIIEYGTDTTRAIASVVFNGVTTRYPRISFIFSHGGGTMPFLIERFLGGTSAEIVPGIRTAGQQGSYVPKQPPAGALAELRRLYYDTAQCANPVAMHALRQVVGTSQILFGTDHFYRSSAETAGSLQGCGVFSDRELESVGRSNALRLWPRLGRIPERG